MELKLPSLQKRCFNRDFIKAYKKFMGTSREDDTRLHLQLHPMKGEEAMGIYKKFHLKLRKNLFPWYRDNLLREVKESSSL